LKEEEESAESTLSVISSIIQLVMTRWCGPLGQLIIYSWTNITCAWCTQPLQYVKTIIKMHACIYKY